jgi:hypothetical protein
VNAYKILAVFLLAAVPAPAFAQYSGDEPGNSTVEMNSYRYPSTSIPRNFGSIPENFHSIPRQNSEPIGPRSIPRNSRSIPSW